MESAAQPPLAPMVITNLRADPGKLAEFQLFVQFNPSQIQEDILINYGRPGVVGQTFQSLQYLGTGNLSLAIDLFFLSRDRFTHDEGDRAKRFLHSLAYPPRSGNSIVSGQPPRALLTWGRVMSLTAKLIQLQTRSQRFNRQGEVVQFTARCNFEEARVTRWSSEEAFLYGSRRTGQSL